MRFFTREEFEKATCDLPFDAERHEAAMQSWDHIIKRYQEHEDQNKHYWSESTQSFIGQNISFHDETIEYMQVSLPRSEIALSTSVGKVLISGIRWLNISTEVSDGNLVWLYHEFVAPESNLDREEGYVEFNVLLELGEMSVTAHDINFSRCK